MNIRIVADISLSQGMEIVGLLDGAAAQQSGLVCEVCGYCTEFGDYEEP